MTDIAYNIVRQAQDLHDSARHGHPHVRVIAYLMCGETIDALRRMLNERDILFASRQGLYGYAEVSVRGEFISQRTLFGARIQEDNRVFAGEVQALIGFAPEPGTGNDPD